VRLKKAASNGYRVSLKTGPVPSPSVGSPDSKRCHDGLSAGLYRASLISATRTAVSAASAAEQISPNPFKGTLGVIGTGVIARTTVEWLLFRNWKFRKISLYDVDRKEAEHFSKWLRDHYDLQADIQDRLEGAISDSSLILFTTTTLDPYLSDEKLFEHCPTVLHLSLRDICVNVILASQNIVDDVDHCLKARTSLQQQKWRREIEILSPGVW